MAGRSVEEILAPLTILKVVSRIKAPGTVMQDILGMQVGGPNVEQWSGRQFVFDIFDNTRQIAAGRSPDASARLVKPQKVGSVNGEFPRSSESILLLAEKFSNFRAIGGPGTIDRRGERYITRQANFLMQRVRNVREFQVAALLRGSYTYDPTEDGSLIHDFSGGGQTIDFQLAAGRKNQLDIIGAGDTISASWALAATDIPGDIRAVDAAFQADTGHFLQDIVVTSVVWNNVLNNDAIKAQAGTAQAPLARIERDQATGKRTAAINGLPLYTWHIVDNVLRVGTGDTRTKLIPDTAAAFLPPWDMEIATYGEGSELVTEETNRVFRQERFGLYMWAEEKGNPAAHHLLQVHNGIPIPYNPAWAFGTVVF